MCKNFLVGLGNCKDFYIFGENDIFMKMEIREV